MSREYFAFKGGRNMLFNGRLWRYWRRMESLIQNEIEIELTELS